MINVLIVEDYEDWRRKVRELIQGLPEFQIICEVSDGVEAVQKAGELNPDLIVLDIGLPKLNGIQAARRIRQLSPSSKIIFLSQDNSLELVQAALSSGAQGFVHKGRAQSDLLPAIDAVLRGEQFVRSSLEFSHDINREASRHELLFFSNEEALLDSLTRFIATALNAGNPALVLINEVNQRALLQRLRTAGVDIDSAIHRGIYTAAEGFNPTRFIEAVEQLSRTAAELGKTLPRIAICGDCAARLWAEGKGEEAIRLEKMSNRIIGSHCVDILCAYPSPQGLENDDTLESIRAEHSTVSFS
jgi:DNA-binding NarL/FixJ family response regulator